MQTVHNVYIVQGAYVDLSTKDVWPVEKSKKVFLCLPDNVFW